MKTKRPLIVLSLLLMFVLACQTVMSGIASPTETAIPTQAIVQQPTLAPATVAVVASPTPAPIETATPSQPDCSTSVVITEKETPKGLYLEVCSNGSTSEVGPLAKGAYAVGPNNLFFVYCGNNGLVYAVRVGDTRLQPIGDVKDFSAIARNDVPAFEIEFLGTGPYKVTIREIKYKQNSTFNIPRNISNP